MGLLSQMARVIVNEHKYRPISGSVLLIGRQTVPLTPKQAIALIGEEGVPIRSNANIVLDKRTRGTNKDFICDASFFNLFCEARVQALDVSDYEGAEIVCNLNLPIPEHLLGQFDFIYNGSCLDNIYDPAASMRNLSRLLKPGGRIVHLEHGSAVNGPYLMFPPDWFHDYYAANNFADCKIYVGIFKGNIDGAWDTYSWDPIVFSRNPEDVWYCGDAIFPPRMDSFIITVAESCHESTWNYSPVQCQYRSKEEQAMIFEVAKRFAKSPRPKLRARSAGVDRQRYLPSAPPDFIPFDSPARHSFGTMPWIKTLVKKSLRTILRMPRPVTPLGEMDPYGIPPSFKFCRNLA